MKRNKIRTNRPKACGCKPTGLTKAFALWLCAGCGHVQRDPRSYKARCQGILADGSQCERTRGRNPRGSACTAHNRDLAVGARCPVEGCLSVGEDMGRIPHPDVEYLTESCERGYFRARDSFLRCVGCLELAPNGRD
jgi:hypothetical protein